VTARDTEPGRAPAAATLERTAEHGSGVAGIEAPRSVTGRALALVAAFDSDHPTLTLTELSRRTGLAMATTHRLARELEAWGALDRDAAGRYGVGVRLWETGMLAPIHAHLREIALPVLLILRDEVHVGVQLAARVGTEAVYVERLPARASLSMPSRVGARLPLHATGVGKALLAFQDDAVIAGVLDAPLAGHGPRTTTDAARLRRELVTIRRDGYATSAEEYRAGTCSVAVPVPSDGRTVSAAVGIVSYELRDDLVEFVPALRRAADAIAGRLADADHVPGTVTTAEDGARDS